MRVSKLSGLLVLGLGLTLAGCNTNPLEVVRSNCPASAIAGETGTVTKFAGTEQRPEDVAYKATITKLALTCTEAADVSSQIVFDIRAQKGPAATSDELTVPYFVLTLKDNRQIIAKKTFTTTIKFNGQNEAATRETISHYLPDIEQSRRYNYEVLVGFQLDESEVLFNALRASQAPAQ